MPLSIKSTNKSNISIYTSWGLCVSVAKRVPVALAKVTAWSHLCPGNAMEPSSLGQRKQPKQMDKRY